MIFSINKTKHHNFIKNFFDDNKLHRNGNYNYFGNTEKIVHGINILLTTLEKLSRKKIIDLTCLDHIEISFNNPIFVNEKTKISLRKSKNFLIIELKNKVKKKCEIKAHFSNLKLLKIKTNNKLNLKKTLKSIGKIKFQNYESLIDPKNLKSFYTIKKILGESRITSIISLSYLIGKIYPGENSLFLSCKIKLNNFFSKDYKYKITKIDKRFNISFIDFSGNGISAELKAHHTKKKLNEVKLILPKLKGVKLMIKDKKKFIILGGSTGIGLALSALILKSGGFVTSTYNKNKSNLLILNKKYKKKMKIKKFDINEPYLKLDFLKKYDYIIYMISPKIFLYKKEIWSEKLFKKFHKYYVKLPIKILNNLNSNQTLFLPSSIALDQNNIDLKEYCKAKKIMEQKFSDKNNMNKNIKILRLDEVENNQTLGNFLSQKKSLIEVSKEIIKEILN